jgi:hypothetical protein
LTSGKLNLTNIAQILCKYANLRKARQVSNKLDCFIGTFKYMDWKQNSLAYIWQVWQTISNFILICTNAMPVVNPYV